MGWGRAMIYDTKTDGNVIYYKFPLSHDYDYARELSYDTIRSIRLALSVGRFDLTQGFSNCHLRILTAISMEHLVGCVE